jgi:hypothetical protein
VIEKIIFFDHVIGDKKPVPCFVVGEVIQEDKLSIVLRYWGCLEQEDDSNDEHVTILKSTVISRLRSGEWVVKEG